MPGIRRIDHVAVAVKNLDEAIAVFESHYGVKLLKKLENQEDKYVVAYLQFGEDIITCLQPLDESSLVAQFIEKSGEGLHHLALEVDDLEALINELDAKGVSIPVRKMEGQARKEVLVSPRNAFGVVLQLVEWATVSDVPFSERIARIIRFAG